MERQSAKGDGHKKQNFFRSLWESIHGFLFPFSNENKKIRYTQLKNISLFIVSTLIFYFFEENIAKLVQLESSEILKQGMQPSAPF